MVNDALELVVGALKERLNDPDLEFAVGARHLATRGAPRRVVWVADGGTLEPLDRTGQRIPYPDHPELVIWPMYKCRLRVDAYLQTQGGSKLEVLWVQLLSAVREMFGADAQPSAFDVETEADRASHSLGDLARMRQRFEWSMLISKATGTREGFTFVAPLAMVTAAQMTYELKETLP